MIIQLYKHLINVKLIHIKLNLLDFLYDFFLNKILAFFSMSSISKQFSYRNGKCNKKTHTTV